MSKFSKYRKIISIILSVCMLILATGVTPVFAKVTGYVTEKDGVQYEYSQEDLIDSIVADPPAGGPAYQRYLTENLVALKDDVRGYIDVNDVIDAIVGAAQEGKTLDVDLYTESEEAKVTEITDVKKVDKDGNVEEEEEELKVIDISAVDGTVTAVLSNAPEATPVIADFTVTKAINGGTAEAVTPTAIDWDAETKTATLTVPLTDATDEEQSVVFSAAYKDTAAEAAAAFTVEAKSTALAVESVIAINDITTDYGVEPELPETVEVTLSDEEETKVDVNVDWSENEEFDLYTAGEYELTGTLVPAEEDNIVVGEEDVATVKITIKAATKATALAAVNKAAEDEEVENVLKALKALKVVDAAALTETINDDLAEGYVEEINASLTNTTARVNAAVKRVNDTVADAVADLITDLTEVTNFNDMFALLEEIGVVRVSEDLADEYFAAVSKDEDDKLAGKTTKADVQDAIDNENKDALDDVVTDAETSLVQEDYNKADALLAALVAVDAFEADTVFTAGSEQKDYEGKLDVVKKIIDANKAGKGTSAVEFVEALIVALGDNSDIVKEVNGEAYLEFYNDTDGSGTKANFKTIAGTGGSETAADDITKFVEEVNGDVEDDAVTAINTALADAGFDKTDEDQQAAFLTLLRDLDAVSDDFDEEIDAGLIEDYMDKLKTTYDAANSGSGGDDDTDTATKINNLVKEVNDDVVVARLDDLYAVANAVSQTADALLEALENPYLNLKNVKAANKEAYLKDKALIAEASKTSTNSGSVTDTVALQKLVNSINLLVDANAATSPAEMQAALTGLAVNQGITSYVNLSSAAKAEVAEVILAVRNKEDNKKFADLDTLAKENNSGNVLFDQTKAYGDFFTAVNAATDIDGMKTALDKEVFPAFQELDEVEKVNAAEAVLDALELLQAETPAKEFKTIAQIKAVAGL